MVVTLEDHLKLVASKVAFEKLDDPIEAFEVVNRRLGSLPPVSEKVRTRADQLQIDLNDEHFKKLQANQAPILNPEAGEPLPLCPTSEVEAELSILRKTGCGFSPEESFAISGSLRNLASEVSNITSLRFWGKILCRESDDYLIAEGLPESPEDPPEGSDEDGLGSGVNTHSYFACTDGVSWSRLPNATPAHIRASRLIKYLFTGDLKSPVDSFPLFPGTEAHLLRSQIARIVFATSLAPRGFYSLDDDGITNTEDFISPYPREVVWVHARPGILKNGKVKYPELPDEENAGERNRQLREMQFDPEVKPLSLAEAVTVRFYGQGIFEIAAVKSKNWPGAVTVFSGKKFFHFYCGYGLKEGGEFTIGGPGDVQGEAAEPEEQAEPHSLPKAPAVEEAPEAVN